MDFKPLFESYRQWYDAVEKEGKTPYDYSCSICGKSPVGFSTSVWMAGVCYDCWHKYDIWMKV